MSGIPNRVRELRIARQWTQQELAERAGVSRQTIHAVEAEKYVPSLPLALIFGRLFETPVEQLFPEDSPRRADG